MKNSFLAGIIVAGVIATASAQDIVIDSIRGNGSMTFWGAQNGSTATVEWAASLTDAGRTNWVVLTNIVVDSFIVTNDIPMFFRVRGILDESLASLTNGLVIYYPFNGNANDKSGKNNNATIYGAGFGTDRLGRSRRCLSVEKTDRVVSSNNIGLSGGNARTIALWFKANTEPVHPSGFLLHWGNTSAAGTMQTLVYHPYHISNPSVLANLAADSYYAGAQALSNPEYLAGSWHHLAFTYSDSLTTSQFYLDGALVDNIKLSFETPTVLNTVDTVFTVNGTPSYNGLDGFIDEVRVYNRVLSPSEIQQLYELPY